MDKTMLRIGDLCHWSNLTVRIIDPDRDGHPYCEAVDGESPVYKIGERFRIIIGDIRLISRPDFIASESASSAAYEWMNEQ
jgi:hypothetical protein